MERNEHPLIVITGGAGFIGSCLIKHLNDNHIDNIVIIDNLECNEKWKNLLGKKFLDIVPINKCFEWIEERRSEIASIIHLGACSSTTEKDLDYLLENNYRFSVRLAEYALRAECRFIYASSAATYGDGYAGFSDAHDAIESLRPLNPYGYSKHLFDLWIKRQGLLNNVVGLKYFNVFGPNEYHKGNMTSAIFKMLPNALQEGNVRLFKSSQPKEFADGEQKRDFIYIKDAVRMTSAFLENNATGIFNIGSGIASTWNELANALFKALKKKPQIEYVGMPAELEGKYQNYTCAEMHKTQRALNEISQTTPLEESVIDYVRDYLIPQKTW